MDIEKLWEKALKKTEIQRARLNKLHTFKATELPYTLLTESSVNIGDTVVRKGTIKVNKPLIIMPHQYPVFEGFNFEEDIHVGDDMLRSFLLMRGISLPSLRYSNKTYSVDLYEDSLKKAIEHYKDILQKKEDIKQGLIVGADDAWKFSLLIYVAAMVSKSASSDIQAFLNKLREEGFHNN
ncbi:MAG: hypothetical protein KAU12_03950 [Candidatus Omnitrophica bacterium]|nr:hypothetical protein [Candidatus Omnitrophota bacterium]